MRIMKKVTQFALFKDKSFVRYFQYFNNTMIVLVREPNDNGKMYQYVLYYLDNDNKPQKIIDDAKLNEKYFYGYEYIDYMTIFNNCEDYFLSFRPIIPTLIQPLILWIKILNCTSLFQTANGIMIHMRRYRQECRNLIFEV